MRRTRGLVVSFAAAALAAAASSLAPGASAEPPGNPTGTYIVVLAPGASSPRAEAARLAREYGGRVGYVYEHALRGFSITTTEQGAEALARSSRVDYVEKDQVVRVDAQTTPTGLGRIFAPGNTNLDIDGSDDFRVDVDIAIIDTGIDLDHPDLNVVGGVNCLSGTCVAGGDDDHYHGTHVAGTAAAIDNDFGVVGVAPGARLWAVKVLDSRGSGTWTGVIAGLDWVAANAATIEVTNMSLGGGRSQAVNDAVKATVDGAFDTGGNEIRRGVNVVVAAGNDSADVKDYSPASEPTAITVSALADFNGLPGGGARFTCYPDADDTFAGFSNYGDVDPNESDPAAVDIIAPGVCIYSTSPGYGYRTISGTSMASPHVAGAVALLRSNGTDISSLTSLTYDSDWTLAGADPDDGTFEPLLDVGTFALTRTSTTVLTSDKFSSFGSSTKGGWTATITVSGAPPGFDVNGRWSDSKTPSSCVTDSGSGETHGCTISRGVGKRVSSVRWTYSQNTTISVTVTKP